MEDKQDAKALITAIMNNSEYPVSANVKTNYIVTTEDKAKLIYRETENARKVTGNTLSWFGAFLSLLIADLTCAQFNGFFGISATIVQAMFYVATVVVFGFFIRSALIWWSNRNKLTIEYFVDSLKGDTKELMQGKNEKPEEKGE